MKLIDDWKKVLTKAWSAKLALLAAILSAVEGVLQSFDAAQFGPWFPIAAAVVSVAAMIARVVAQPAMHADENA